MVKMTVVPLSADFSLKSLQASFFAIPKLSFVAILDDNDRPDGEDDTFDFCFGILLTLRGSSPISKEDSKLAQYTAPQGALQCVQWYRTVECVGVCSGS